MTRPPIDTTRAGSIVAAVWSIAVTCTVLLLAALLWQHTADRTGPGPERPGVAAGLITVADTSPGLVPGRDHGEHELHVRVRAPAILRSGHDHQLRLDVLDASGHPLPASARVEVELSLRLHPAARGTLWVTPDRLLVAPPDLRWQRVELGSTERLPCDAPLGDLRVEVRELHDGGRQGQAVVELPAATCEPGSGPPAASGAVHLRAPVCGAGWRDEIERLLAGGSPDRWCRTHPDRDRPPRDVPRRAPRSPAPTQDPSPAAPEPTRPPPASVPTDDPPVIEVEPDDDPADDPTEDDGDAGGGVPDEEASPTPPPTPDADERPDRGRDEAGAPPTGDGEGPDAPGTESPAPDPPDRAPPGAGSDPGPDPAPGDAQRPSGERSPDVDATSASGTAA